MHKSVLLGSVMALGLAGPHAQAQPQPAQQQAQSEPRAEPRAQIRQMATEDKFLPAQTQNHWLSNEIIGQQVQNQAGEALGEVQYLVFDESNGIVAAVIGVGGFLGIGEKSVAIRFDAISRRRTDQGVELLAKVDERALDAAPSFETAPAASPDAPGERTTAPETASTVEQAGATTAAQPAEVQKQAETSRASTGTTGSGEVQ